MQQYLHATLLDANSDLGATIGITLTGAAREWFVPSEFNHGTWANSDQLFVARFKNEDVKWYAFQRFRSVKMREDLDTFLEDVENAQYELSSNADVERMYKL